MVAKHASPTAGATGMTQTARENKIAEMLRFESHRPKALAESELRQIYSLYFSVLIGLQSLLDSSS
jgi:hypothetical protein